ncbi:sugar ABC transporter substrate-binding protein [Parachitinimonas caeni]|uniref:Sugar ABC transporter substrate-binding protein n=1 Tax=Parachitinimonas caeni TaxID=3031301 RepID=A0ABT7DXT9_9NEIS|nr:sugar ABC transporter substrate-binding protein [Parachitinimonas caeni]MDK2124882.1 sugar ABC transporter substrate-binding protein [Parachitinimonas caeni]
MFRTQAVLLFCMYAMTCLLPAEAASKVRVTLVMKSMANEFFRTMEAGARTHQRSNPDKYELTATGIDNETDVEKQIKLVEQAISAKTQAIVIAPADSKELVPVLKKAIEGGIVVVNIDNKLDDLEMSKKGLNIPFVGPSNRLGARQVGEFLGKQLSVGDEVAIIEGLSGTVNAQARTAGFREAMEAVGAKIVGIKSGKWEQALAQDVAANFLKDYPNLKAFLCGNDSMALGAVTAVGAAGKTGKVKIVGYDNIAAVKPMLADGRMLATADQYGGRQAVFGIELALKTLEEKTPQRVLPPIVQTPVVLVTK